MEELETNAARPDSEHYREMAKKLQELAREFRFPDARREILDLAARYERRADNLAHLIHQEAEGEWRFARDGRKRSCTRRLFHRWDLVSAAGAGGVSGRVWRGDSGPVAYGAAGISPAAMWRIRGASGQAAAKASRTR